MINIDSNIPEIIFNFMYIFQWLIYFLSTLFIFILRHFPGIQYYGYLGFFLSSHTLGVWL